MQYDYKSIKSFLSFAPLPLSESDLEQGRWTCFFRFNGSKIYILLDSKSREEVYSEVPYPQKPVPGALVELLSSEIEYFFPRLSALRKLFKRLENTEKMGTYKCGLLYTLREIHTTETYTPGLLFFFLNKTCPHLFQTYEEHVHAGI